MHVKNYFVVLVLCCAVCVNEGYRFVCYYTRWSTLQPEGIPPSLCTHIIFGFATIIKHNLDLYTADDAELYSKLNALKSINPDLKTLIAVGWENRVTFSNMVSQARKMNKFVKNAAGFLRTHGFDGLDIVWEYPTIGQGARATDRDNFGMLCNKLRTAFESEAAKSGEERLMLSAAVSPVKSIIDGAYDVPTLASNLDFISIATYDFGGKASTVAAHHSPLEARPEESGSIRNLTIEWAVKYWLDLGASKEQLNIGIAMYGIGYTLENAANSGYGAAVTGPCTPGPVTKAMGYKAFYEVCEMITTDCWTRRENGLPYCVSGDQWIGYDDKISVQEKVFWLTSEGLGGVMIWSLGLDDYQQFCEMSSDRFPILNTIKADIEAAENGTLTKIDSGNCDGKSDGLYPDMLDYTKFYMCSAETKIDFTCPPPLMFNKDILNCMYPHQIKW